MAGASDASFVTFVTSTPTPAPVSGVCGVCFDFDGGPISGDIYFIVDGNARLETRFVAFGKVLGAPEPSELVLDALDDNSCIRGVIMSSVP